MNDAGNLMEVGCDSYSSFSDLIEFGKCERKGRTYKENLFDVIYNGIIFPDILWLSKTKEDVAIDKVIY